MKPPKKTWIGKSKKRLSFYLVMLISFVSVTLVILYGVNDKTQSIPVEKPATKIEEPIEKEVQTAEELFPDQQTQFFSKEEGKPLLYYAIVNDSVKFFKTDGIEPSTGQKLLPVTQDIVDLYQENIAAKKEIAMVESRDFKVKEVKIIKKKEKPKKEKPKRKSIWNTELINSTNEDEISLFVFNGINELDHVFMNKFKEQFIKKNYFVTDEIIFSDMMNSEIAENLKSANIKYFNHTLKKYTDYVCIGSVSYAYEENEYRNDFLDCTLKIIYFIYDSATGQQMFSDEDKLIGSGQTKDLARKEAIKKFIL